MKIEDLVIPNLKIHLRCKIKYAIENSIPVHTKKWYVKMRNFCIFWRNFTGHSVFVVFWVKFTQIDRCPLYSFLIKLSFNENCVILNVCVGMHEDYTGKKWYKDLFENFLNHFLSHKIIFKNKTQALFFKLFLICFRGPITAILNYSFINVAVLKLKK